MAWEFWMFDWIAWGGPVLPPFKHSMLCRGTCVSLWEI